MNNVRAPLGRPPERRLTNCGPSSQAQGNDQQSVAPLRPRLSVGTNCSGRQQLQCVLGLLVQERCVPLPAVLYASPLRGRSPGAQRTARVLDESGGAGWPRAAKPFHVLARPSEQNIDDVLAAMGMLKCSNMGSVTNRRVGSCMLMANSFGLRKIGVPPSECAKGS